MRTRNILYTILLVAVLLFSGCTEREAPVGTDPFLISFAMPEGMRTGSYYAGQTVCLSGPVEYAFETDIRGMVSVSSVVPGIYDIITHAELSGLAYKALFPEADAPNVPDNARVTLGVSLMNQKIFQAADLEIALTAAVQKDLLISKVYYSGTRDKMDRTYTSDSYVEIFNNSDGTVYIDGRYLGLAECVSPAAYPAKDNPDSIYLRQVCRFPGSGTDYPVAPGGSILVAARSARNHFESADNTVDLSGAEFEVKTADGGTDATRLPFIHNSTTTAYLNLLSGGPNAVVLFETEEDVSTWPLVYQPKKTSGELFLRMHKKFVTDGVECLKKPAQNDPDVNTKRLQNDIDAGYVVINSVNGYIHESVDRKVASFSGERYYLTDTNNSSADFVVCSDPTPRKYDKEGLQ